jgi:D-alanine-D-alanine ligase
MKKNIAILMGGYSSEYNISVKSGQVVYEVLLKESDLNIYKVYISKDSWYHEDNNGNKTIINKKDFTFYSDNSLIKIDKVFNTIHGVPGEDGEIQEYLKSININQTSSEKEEAKLTFNKNECKKAVSNFNVDIPNSILIDNNSIINIEKITKELNLPYFIKPNKGGSSYGISKVEKKEQIEVAIKKALNEDTEVLIEEEIKGREISIGVIDYNNEILALPPTEICSYNSFFDYNAKYKGESDEITPADISLDYKIKAQKIATKIYKKLKLKGFSRTDFILKNDKFYFLEVNTNPGLTKESILPKQAEAAGISLSDLFKSVIE